MQEVAAAGARARRAAGGPRTNLRGAMQEVVAAGARARRAAEGRRTNLRGATATASRCEVSCRRLWRQALARAKGRRGATDEPARAAPLQQRAGPRRTVLSASPWDYPAFRCWCTLVLLGFCAHALAVLNSTETHAREGGICCWHFLRNCARQCSLL